MKLVEEGIPVILVKSDSDECLKDAQLIVFTPAVPKAHQELVYYQEHNYPY